MKAKTPNQIREEVRKQMASKFNEEKEHLKEEKIKRLLEFMDLPDDKRQKSYQTYVKEKEFSEMLTTFLSPFWGNLFSL